MATVVALVTDKNREKKSAGFSVSIDYKREYVSYYTYCISTGNKEDMCYEKLNKFVTNCGNWSEK